MKIKWLCALLLVVSFIGIRGEAADVITVDPNTPEAAQAREQAGDFWTADTRLAQKVTYQARRRTVLAILNDLSKSTGVTLRAGYNNLDWQVRDRNMLVSAQELSLAELMQSIARVMKFKWSRSESEPYTYRLYMDRRTLLQEEGQAYRAEQKFLELQKKKREDLIDTFAELAKKSGPEIEAMKEESPYSYIIARAGLAGPLSTMFREISEFKQTFMEGGDYQIRIKDFSPQGQKAVVDALRALHTMCANPNPLPDDLDQRLDKIGIDLSPGVGSDSPAFMRHLVLGALEVECYDPRAGGTLAIVDPDSIFGKQTGRTMAYIMNGGDPEEAVKMFRVEKNEIEDLADQDFGEARVKHEDDPEMEREIELPANNLKEKDSNTREYKKPWDLMLALAKASGCSVVSDYLGGGGVAVDLPAKTKLIHAVQPMESDNFNWWRHGNVLEFRDRYWYRKRSLQIPEEYVGRWRDIYENGTIGIADVVEMSTMLLSGAKYSEKYAVNISGDEVLDDQSVERATMGLRPTGGSFYTCLDRKQRASLEAGSWLSVDELTPEQINTLKTELASDDVSGKMRMEINKGSTERKYELILWKSGLPHSTVLKACVPVRKKPNSEKAEQK